MSCCFATPQRLEVSPAGLLEVDGSTHKYIPAISAHAAAWCFVYILRLDVCALWNWIPEGKPRRIPLVVCPEDGRARSETLHTQSSTVHTRADCQARGGRETGNLTLC